MTILKGGLAIVFIVANTFVCCVPIYLFAIPRLLIPIDRVRVALSAAMTRVIDAWVGGNHLLIKAIGMTRIQVRSTVPMPLLRDRWYVVVSNHQGWSDILVLQDTFLGRIPPLKFFVKRQLIWIPLLGFAMWLLEFPYVRRYSREALENNPELRRHDQDAIRRASEHFKRQPTSVLNFMEGTRFSVAKHEYQKSKYHNLLMPKTGGFGYVVAALGNRIEQIIDVTIFYPGGVPSFWEFLSGQSREVHVYIASRQVPVALFEGHDELATDVREGLREWVDDLWTHKDERIDELRAVKH